MTSALSNLKHHINQLFVICALGLVCETHAFHTPDPLKRDHRIAFGTGPALERRSAFRPVGTVFGAAAKRLIYDDGKPLTIDEAAKLIAVEHDIPIVEKLQIDSVRDLVPAYLQIRAAAEKSDSNSVDIHKDDYRLLFTLNTHASDHSLAIRKSPISKKSYASAAYATPTYHHYAQFNTAELRRYASIDSLKTNLESYVAMLFKKWETTTSAHVFKRSEDEMLDINEHFADRDFVVKVSRQILDRKLVSILSAKVSLLVQDWEAGPVSLELNAAQLAAAIAHVNAKFNTTLPESRS